MYKVLNCKLYKASPRKDKILAAMQNPNNRGLMMQLAKYLDEEYQTDEYLTKEDDNSSLESDEGNGGDGASIRDSEGSGGLGGGYSGDIAGLDEGMDLVDEPESESDLEELMSEDADSSESDSSDIDDDGSDDSSDVEESTKVEGKKVVACDMTASTLETIKSTLNLVDTTQGVKRAAFKNNELWLYYDDDKNLNNIMEFVIEALPSMGINWAEFNRLARSDNAIVFEIVEQTVSLTQEVE